MNEATYRLTGATLSAPETNWLFTIPFLARAAVRYDMKFLAVLAGERPKE